MGGDLFGSMRFGPVAISPEKVAQADARYANLRAEALNAPRFTFTGPIVLEEFIPPALMEAIDHLANDGLIDGDEPWDALVREFLDLGDTFVAEVVDAWNFRGRRDQAWRDVPSEISGEEKWVCMFTGMTSWGDGPDEDSTQTLFDRADSLGLIDLLGLK